MAKLQDAITQSSVATGIGSSVQANYYTLIVLGIITLVNYADRMVLSVLLEPIKAELQLSDSQLGLLSGLAFSVVYGIAGIPLARLADKRSRVKLLSIAIIAWSAMTALCGMAQNFIQLLLARIGVGIGEAGCVPASHSLVGDLFPKEQRAFAIGLLHACGYLGVILGLMSAGLIAEKLGWRWAFMLFALPGIVIAIAIYLTVAEPARGRLEKVTPSSACDMGLSEVLYTLFKRSTYRHLLVALSLGVFTLDGIGQWVPSFFVRNHGLSLTEVGTSIGLTSMGGLIGVVLGSLIVSKLIVRDSRWELWLPALGYIASIPFYLITFVSPSVSVALCALFTAGFMGALGMGAGVAAIQAVAESYLRATAVAVAMFSSAFLGLGAGPFLVGLVSDSLIPVYGEGGGLRISLAVSTVIIAWSALHFILAARVLHRDRVS